MRSHVSSYPKKPNIVDDDNDLDEEVKGKSKDGSSKEHIVKETTEVVKAWDDGVRILIAASQHLLINRDVKESTSTRSLMI